MMECIVDCGDVKVVSMVELRCPCSDAGLGCAEARVNVVDFASAAGALRRWVSITDILHSFRSVKVLNRKPGEKRKFCVIMTWVEELGNGG